MAKRNTATVDEELKSGINLKTFKRLSKYLKPYAKGIAFVIFIMLISSAASLITPYLTSLAIDKYVPEKNIPAIIIIALMMLLCFLVIKIILKKRALVINNIGQSFILNLRSDLFAHLQKLPFSYFDSRPHGKILVRIVGYVNSIASLFSDGIVDIITSIFTIVVTIVFMFSLDVKFTLICLSGIPIFLIIISILRASHRKAWQILSAKQSNLNAYIHESISGVKVTQAFNRENEDLRRFTGICQDNKKYWMKAKHIEMGIPVSVEIITVLVTVALYYFGAIGIANQTVKLGLLIAFASYVSRFWTPISTLANYYNQIVTCSAYIERIFEVLDEPLVIEDVKDAYELPEIVGNVKFENVVFSYEEGTRNILDNVSFDVKPGETVAFVGPTGAGKSTIVNLLSRFYNINDGKITIDGNDISKATLSSLRKQMGVMLQDSFLFTGTIMDNIKYSKLDATDDEVYEVAKAVCAHDVIMSLPDGYNTMVTERGDSLSSGQKQLICFARTLLGNPKILILDEATSNIDTETELALQKGLNKLLEGRTSFIIAHRLSTIIACSKIMYIADGNIQESGTHEELLAKKGKYYDLYNSQFKFLGEI